jgi:hypothetical protein
VNLRPILSVTHPLSGLAIKALAEKAGIIQPKYLSPPTSLSIVGSSGITRLKEKKKSNAATQSLKNSGG